MDTQTLQTNPTSAGNNDELLGKTWSERMENIISDLLGSIPAVGGFLAGLVDLFWPGKSLASAFELMMKDMVKLVDIKIVNSEYLLRQEQVNAVRDDLLKYRGFAIKDDGKHPEIHADRKTLLLIIEGKLSTLYEEFIPGSRPVGSSSQPGDAPRVAAANAESTMAAMNDERLASMLPLAVTTAHLYLGVLRELYDVGTEAEQTIWLKAIRDQCAEYDWYFVHAENAYNRWRMSQAEITRGPTHPGGTGWKTYIYANLSLNDSWTGEKWKFAMRGPDPMEGGFEPGVADAVSVLNSRLNSDALADAAVILNSTFSFDRAYIPGNENAPAKVMPALQSLVVGPYLRPMSGADSKDVVPSIVHPNILDTPGRVTEVRLSTPPFPASMIMHEAVSAVQLVMDGREGKVGGSKTGSWKTLTVADDDHLQDVLLQFYGVESMGNLLGIAFRTAAGQVLSSGSSDVFEQHPQEKGTVELSAGPGYHITGAQYRNSALGIETIAFRFTQRTLQPTTG